MIKTFIDSVLFVELSILFTVLFGWDACHSFKYTAEIVIIIKADFIRDYMNRQRSFYQQAFGFINTKITDMLGNAYAKIACSGII